MVTFDSRRKKLQALSRQHLGSHFVDVTSRGDAPWVHFSHFFPHGGIPVPFTPRPITTSVEGI